MRTVIIDGRMCAEGQRSLMLLGYQPIALPSVPTVSEAICSHPDTLLFRFEDEIVTSCGICEQCVYVFSDLRERHPNITLRFSSDEPGSSYPQDAIFNALAVGGKLFCRADSISGAVLELAERRGLDVVNVAQGYPACSTLVLSDSSVVTADRGLARVFERCGINVTLIRAGHIALPPYEYGFIGGATAVHGGMLFSFGDLDTHPDGGRIKEAAYAAGLGVRSLFGGMLVDLGGAVFLE